MNSFTKKTTERICIKFGVCLWYAVRKKRLNFGGDPDQDLDFVAGFFFQGSILKYILTMFLVPFFFFNWFCTCTSDSRADGGSLHLYWMLFSWGGFPPCLLFACLLRVFTSAIFQIKGEYSKLLYLLKTPLDPLNLSLSCTDELTIFLAPLNFFIYLLILHLDFRLGGRWRRSAFLLSAFFRVCVCVCVCVCVLAFCFLKK